MKILKQYELACEKLKDAFLNSLYEDEIPDDSYWVAEEIGGVLSWGDWYVGMDIMADYFRYNYTPTQFFDWYDQIHEDNKMNMRSWIKLKK